MWGSHNSRIREQEIGKTVPYSLFPVPFFDESAYLTALQIAAQKISDFQAEVLIVATGFDTFKDDPFGCFTLESPSYYKIGSTIRSLNLPTLFVQEGGYFVAALRENVRQLIAGFDSEGRLG